MISEAQFKTVIPDVNWIYAQNYVSLLDTVLPKYEINTPLRTAHFLAQIAHESGGFKFVVENLNYSAEALYSVFRKYFPMMDLAANYARKPQQIANKVYANRMGNGDESSNDGWNYRGRGLLQITGKTNYQTLTQETGEDFISTPENLEQPQWALTSACWFWKKRNLNKYADADDIHMVTKLINGGTNGLSNRQHYLDEFKKLLGI